MTTLIPQVFLEVFPHGDVPGKPRNGSDPCPKCRYQMSNRQASLRHLMPEFLVQYRHSCWHYDFRDIVDRSASMPVWLSGSRLSV